MITQGCRRKGGLAVLPGYRSRKLRTWKETLVPEQWSLTALGLLLEGGAGFTFKTLSSELFFVYICARLLRFDSNGSYLPTLCVWLILAIWTLSSISSVEFKKQASGVAMCSFNIHNIGVFLASSLVFDTSLSRFLKSDAFWSSLRYRQHLYWLGMTNKS
jgi:hypothetical protein